MCPLAIEREVKELKDLGRKVELVDLNGQCYVVVRSLVAPQPPWDRDNYDILIAIPAAYDAAGLDGFYLSLPYAFNEGKHPRVNGGTIAFDALQWQLVSWHYVVDGSWQRGRDCLDTHITHCVGFFAHRGAIGDY